MQTTRRGMRRITVAALLLVPLLAVSGCGEQLGVASQSAPTPIEADSRLPERLVDALSRSGVDLRDSGFVEGISAAQSLAAFADMYDPAAYAATPTAYAAVIESSDVYRVTPGQLVRIVHVPGVERDIIGPALPAGAATPTPDVIVTDMVAIFDADSGKHLFTVYAGP